MAVFVSSLPQSAIYRAVDCFANTTDCFSCSGDRYLISKGDLVMFDFSPGYVQLWPRFSLRKAQNLFLSSLMSYNLVNGKYFFQVIQFRLGRFLHNLGKLRLRCRLFSLAAKPFHTCIKIRNQALRNPEKSWRSNLESSVKESSMCLSFEHFLSLLYKDFFCSHCTACAP